MRNWIVLMCAVLMVMIIGCQGSRRSAAMDGKTQLVDRAQILLSTDFPRYATPQDVLQITLDYMENEELPYEPRVANINVWIRTDGEEPFATVLFSTRIDEPILVMRIDRQLNVVSHYLGYRAFSARWPQAPIAP